MSSQTNKNDRQARSYQQEPETKRQQLRERVKQRMREPDVERRIQQRQKDLLQEALGHGQSPSADPEKRALLDNVKRLYCEQRAQQGRIGILQIVRDDVEREVKIEVEQEAAMS